MTRRAKFRSRKKAIEIFSHKTLLENLPLITNIRNKCTRLQTVNSQSEQKRIKKLFGSRNVLV